MDIEPQPRSISGYDSDCERWPELTLKGGFDWFNGPRQLWSEDGGQRTFGRDIGRQGFGLRRSYQQSQGLVVRAIIAAAGVDLSTSVCLGAAHIL